MENFKTLRITLAATFLLVGKVAYAQVYSWKDANTGESKLSNIAPPWYSRGDLVSGPRVVETFGGKVVDDTALSYEDRLLLSGKSKDYIEKLHLQKYREPRTRQDPIRESRTKTDAEAANRHSADTTPNSSETVGKKGS